MMNNFLLAVLQGAFEGYRAYRILPSLTISQAILESGWGKQHIANNIFGIKAGTGWNGKVVERKTKEYINGQWVTTTALFRAYPSFKESIIDYARLLGTSKRYEALVGECDYREACLKVFRAGYATDPNYALKLISLIEQYRLYLFDYEVLLNEILIRVGNEVKKVQGYFRNGTNYIPIRFLEQIGCSVSWEPGKKEITVNPPGPDT